MTPKALSDAEGSLETRPENSTPHGSDTPALPSEIDLRDYIDVIRRRWWIPLLLGLAAGTTVHWYGLSQPEQYSANVLLQSQERGRSLEQLGLGLESGSRPEDVNTQIEILRSRGVVGPVVDTLQLTLGILPPHVPRSRFFDMVWVDPTAPEGAYEIQVSGTRVTLVNRETRSTVGVASSEGVLEGPGFLVVLADAGLPLREEEVPLVFFIKARSDVMQDLADAMEIEHVRGTNLIRVGYTSPDRELTTSVVNTLTASYQAYSGRRGGDESRRRREFLGTQLAQLADSMAATQQQLADYQQESRTLNPEIEGAALLDALFRAESDLRRLRFEESIMRSIVRSLESGDESDEIYERMLTIGADLIPALGDMYERLQQVRANRRLLTDSRYGLTSTAPDVEPLDSMISSVKSEMRGVLEQSLGLVQNRLTSALERLEEIRGDVGELPARAAVFTRFQQRVDQVQNIFDMLAENYYEAQIAENVEMGDVELVDPAQTPIRPDPSNSRRTMVLAALIGIIVGIGLALCIEHFDQRIRSAPAAERVTQLRVLAVVPRMKMKNKIDRIIFHQPQNGEQGSNREVRVGAEAFRTLRTTLRFTETNGRNVFAVTSSLPEEGKTTVAANLAVAMSCDGAPVLLIDGDLRRPRMHTVFGLDRELGLSDILTGDATLGQTIQRTGYSDLSVILAGTPVTNPAELLGRDGFSELLESVSQDYTVMIDTPPTLAVSDSSLIGSVSSAVIIVAQSEKTPEPALVLCVKKMRQLRIPLVGLVLNDVSSNILSSYGYGYYAYHQYYYSSYEDHDNPAKRGLLDRLLRGA